MVLFFTTTLALSIVAMVLLLTLKRYELATGRVVFAGARPALNSFFHTVLWFGQQVLPELARNQIERGWNVLLAGVQRAIAYTIVSVEHVLERILHTVRERTQSVRPSGEPSAFLREVADHKKTLLYKKGLKKPILKEPAPRDTVQQ